MLPRSGLRVRVPERLLVEAQEHESALEQAGDLNGQCVPELPALDVALLKGIVLRSGRRLVVRLLAWNRLIRLPFRSMQATATPT